MSLKAKLPIWVFITVAAIGIAVIILLLQYRDSVFGEIKLQSLENAYWTKIIPQKDELSGWKTYRNEEYGFEVKYPTDWNVSPGAESAADIFKNGILYTSFQFSIIPPSDLYTETAGIVVSHTLLDYDNQPIDAQWSAIKCKSDEKDCTVFKNENGVSIAKYSFDDNIHGQHDFLAYVATGKVILAFYEELGIDDKTGIRAMEKIFDQILSTFKFIEPIDTSNWNTYRNEEYGFEFKYPNNWKSRDNLTDIIGPADSILPFVLPENPADMTGTCKVSIGRFDNPDNLSLSDWLKQAEEETGALPPISSVPITIDGVTGIKEVIEEIGLATTVYLPKGDRIIAIALLCGDDVFDKCNILFNQILSTFKFIK
jgi:hypothetical protein